MALDQIIVCRTNAIEQNRRGDRLAMRTIIIKVADTIVGFDIEMTREGPGITALQSDREGILRVKVFVDTIMEDTSHRTYEKGVERLMREPVTILELATIGPGVMDPGIGHREESRHTDGRGLRGCEVDREVGRLGTPEEGIGAESKGLSAKGARNHREQKGYQSGTHMTKRGHERLEMHEGTYH